MSNDDTNNKSSLLKMESFQPLTSDQQDAIFNPQIIPKENDIYWNDERYFLPEGKDFDDLTPEELQELKNKYRFDPLRPGIYQGLTGMCPDKGTGNMI